MTAGAAPQGELSAADGDTGLPPAVEPALPSQEQSLTGSSLAANDLDADPMQDHPPSPPILCEPDAHGVVQIKRVALLASRPSAV